MDKATSLPARFPDPSGPNPSGCVRLCEFEHTRIPPRRSSVLSTAAPAPPASSPPFPAQALARSETIERLRQRLRAIERPHPGDRPPIGDTRPGRQAAVWSLGMPEADALLGPDLLETAACHEIKPASAKAGSRAAALAFALALARRRLDTASPQGRGLPRILWCDGAGAQTETGLLHAPGLARFGLDPSLFLMVEARRGEDVLWALEEGLRSGSLALAIGSLDKIALTPARRLSLAARDGATPVLLLTSARAAASGATATRWRVDPAASAVHPFDARAPGAARFRVRLERCRSAPPAPEAALTLEWSDETHRFRLAAALADRTPEAAHARRRAG